jgi:ketosteroid isomerase-like protein
MTCVTLTREGPTVVAMAALAKELVMAPTRFSAADPVRVLLEAIDPSNLDTLEAPTAADVHFQLGNTDPTETRSERRAPAQSYPAAIAALQHESVDVLGIGNGTVMEIRDVHHRRLDGRELNPPCCNVFHVSACSYMTTASTWTSTQ